MEGSSGKINRALEKNFQGEIEEMNRKHDVVMNQKEQQMDGLADNLTTLNAFKDTK